MRTAEIKFNKFLSFNQADLFYESLSGTAFIVAKVPYLPLEDLKELFLETEEMMTRYDLKWLVSDLSCLEIFDKAALEWFYLEWSSKMYACHGLVEQCILLPKDTHSSIAFESTRDRILAAQPESNIHHLDIQYQRKTEQGVKHSMI